MINIQPITKRRQDDDGAMLEVHSIFKTIQGEGPFTGCAAVFVRLGGCNLQCPRCDTDYTEGVAHNLIETIVHETELMKLPARSRLVVITGGEPLRQNITPLVSLLLEAGFTVQIETNGTLAPPPGLYELCSTDTRQLDRCFIVCSPKTGKVHPALFNIICAYKYVAAVDDMMADGLPSHALGHTASPYLARPHEDFEGTVYIQPCDEKDLLINSANTDACVNSVLQHGYTLQLQVHKIINVD